MPKNMEDLAGCYCLPKDCSHGGLEDLTVCNYLPKDFILVLPAAANALFLPAAA